MRPEEKEMLIEEQIKLGGYLTAQWGYDQTNITYFKVLKMTDKTVTLQEWQQAFVESVAYLSELVVAGDNPAREQHHFVDENGDFQTEIRDKQPIRRNIKTNKDGSQYVKINSYMYAFPTDPERKLLQTHYH